VIFSWEYPPRVVGDLARYVERLATALANRRIDVHVVTFHEDAPTFEERNGVKIHRVRNPVKTHINIISWVLTLIAEFERVFADICYHYRGEVDVIDTHEWLCVPAALAVTRAFRIPFVYTIHSLEEQRSHNASDPLNLTIQNIEKLGIDEARRIQTTSKWMKSEIVRLRNVRRNRIRVSSPHARTWVSNIVKTYQSVPSNTR
jgi:glycosyltransferase involved in cell wall biosynthesis